jgi:hypothetical protein
MTRGQRRSLAGTLVALPLMFVLLGCTGEASAPPATPAPTSSASAPLATAPPPTPANGAASAVASPSDPPAPALPAHPPEAILDGLGRTGRAVGGLGSYTWLGSGSDAPWIVGRAAGAASRGAALRVTFAGSAPVSWTSAWAPVIEGAAGTPTGESSGAAAVAIAGPMTAGDWSLRVTATFAPGASATYFWRVKVTP